MLQKTTNKPTTCQKDGSVRNNLLFFHPYFCAYRIDKLQVLQQLS